MAQSGGGLPASSAAPLEGYGIAGGDLKPPWRTLTQHDARRDAGIRMIADDGYAKATCAQQVRGAIAVDANQIGHDVSDAALAAIDQERYLRPVRFRRRILRDHGSGRVVGGADLRDGGQLQAVLLRAQLRRTFGFAEKSRNDVGSRPGADPDLHAALASRLQARLWILADDFAGRDGRIHAPRFLDLQVQSDLAEYG